MLPPVLGAALLAASRSCVESSQGLVDAPRFEAGNTAFEMADLNGDGYLDLVSIGDHGNPLIGAQEEGIMAWLGDGHGGWACSHAGELGYVGIAVGDLNDGNGRWRRSFGFLGGNSGSVFGFGEIDGDGVPDIGVSKEEGTAWLGDGFYAAADGTLPPVGGWGSREGVSLGDFDGDGHDDVAWCDASGNAQVWLWRAGQQWVGASEGLPADGRCDRTQLHDMDGDGATDLVTLGSRTLRVIAGNGAGTAWSVAAAVTLPDSPGDANALRAGGDVDRNGRPDIVMVATQKIDTFNVRNKVRCYRESSTPPAPAVRVVRPGPQRRLLAGSASWVEWASAVPGGVPSRVRIEFAAAGAYRARPARAAACA